MMDEGGGGGGRGEGVNEGELGKLALPQNLWL